MKTNLAAECGEQFSFQFHLESRETIALRVRNKESVAAAGAEVIRIKSTTKGQKMGCQAAREYTNDA